MVYVRKPNETVHGKMPAVLASIVFIVAIVFKVLRRPKERLRAPEARK